MEGYSPPPPSPPTPQPPPPVHTHTHCRPGWQRQPGSRRAERPGLLPPPSGKPPRCTRVCGRHAHAPTHPPHTSPPPPQTPSQRLSLSDSQLSCLPESLTCVGTLTHLDLSRNDLVELPEDFHLLLYLEELLCSGNSFPRIPKVWGAWVGGGCGVGWEGGSLRWGGSGAGVVGGWVGGHSPDAAANVRAWVPTAHTPHPPTHPPRTPPPPHTQSVPSLVALRRADLSACIYMEVAAPLTEWAEWECFQSIQRLDLRWGSVR